MDGYLLAEANLHTRMLADFNAMKLMFRLGVLDPNTPILPGLPLDTQTIKDSIWSGDTGDPQNSPVDTITIASNAVDLQFNLSNRTTTTTTMAPMVSNTTTAAPTNTTTTTSSTTTTTTFTPVTVNTTTTTTTMGQYVLDQNGTAIPLGQIVL
jgi:hypothetical protein